MIELYIVTSAVVLWLIIRAVRRKGRPAAGTAVGVGSAPSWYQKVSSAQWLTALLWGIGVGLVWLVANKYWRIETGVVWGEWSSSRENFWITILSLSLLVGIIARAILFRREHASSTSAHSTYGGGRRRFSLTAAVWTSVGLALLGLLVLKVWHEFEFGLSNAPERMAARGYVPRESVAVALAAIAPALPEVRTITAPPLGADGKTNWSDEVIRREDRWFYLRVPDSLTNLVERRVDGVITNFGATVKGRRNEFRSRTNYPIEVRWMTPSRQLTAEERKAID